MFHSDLDVPEFCGHVISRQNLFFGRASNKKTMWTLLSRIWRETPHLRCGRDPTALSGGCFFEDMGRNLTGTLGCCLKMISCSRSGVIPSPKHSPWNNLMHCMHFQFFHLHPSSSHFPAAPFTSRVCDRLRWSRTFVLGEGPYRMRRGRGAHAETHVWPVLILKLSS